MARIIGPPASVTRNKPIANELKNLLEQAADAAGIDTVQIVSGGQPARDEGDRRTGSTRHDHGRAADLKLVKNGRTLTFTDQDGGATVEAFVTAAAARGATGIGAGLAYMGNKTLHVGFGTSPQDRSTLVWGAGGRSSAAPGWLKIAAEKGWSSAEPRSFADAAASAHPPGRFAVIARGGLRLRNGPGLAFDSPKTLDAGAEVSVLGFDGPSDEWARVDLRHDGLVDGHVLAAFLKPADADPDDHEHVEEPDHPDDD